MILLRPRLYAVARLYDRACKLDKEFFELPIACPAERLPQGVQQILSPLGCHEPVAKRLIVAPRFP
jgi:hypothetical protein